MKKYVSVAAGFLVRVLLIAVTAPAVAATIDINVGTPAVVQQPPVYMMPRPVYVRQQYESDWRERQLRAIEWRDNPANHGQTVNASMHARKSKREKHLGKKMNDKHGH